MDRISNSKTQRPTRSDSETSYEDVDKSNGKVDKTGGVAAKSQADGDDDCAEKHDTETAYKKDPSTSTFDKEDRGHSDDDNHRAHTQSRIHGLRGESNAFK